MKHFKILHLALAALLIASPASAITARLGAEYGVDFNQVGVLAKTTTYTVTTADAGKVINCDTTSAGFTVTLPSLSTVAASGSSMAIKLVKTDSSVNVLTVAPATGNTIGGESTRKIINQNGYMVLRASGSDWAVSFESPYVVEDHAAGTSNLGTQAYNESIVFEGATADAYETTLSVVDPTGDSTWTIPDGAAGTTQYFMSTSLATNRLDAANAVTGTSNGIRFEGATADAYETTVSPQDPTADNTVTIPDDTGTIMTSTLATNGQDVANSVWGASNGLIFEGATADAYELTITPVDPTADRTVTFPDATGTVALRTGEITTGTDTLTAGECGKVIFLNSATEYQTTLPAVSTVPAGCTFDFIVKAAASAANYTVVTGNSLENKIYGSMEVAGAVVACAEEDTITFVDGNAVGDYARVVSDGANWYVRGSTVTTGKATCSQVD